MQYVVSPSISSGAAVTPGAAPLQCWMLRRVQSGRCSVCVRVHVFGSNVQQFLDVESKKSRCTLAKHQMLCDRVLGSGES